jgi:AraC family transcriptional regulator, transcriptional activator of pobA
MQSRQKIVNYEGLYGDNETALSNRFIHCEAIETRSQKHDWLIRSHFHASLFQFFYVKTGKGVLKAGNIENLFQGPCLLLIPENSLHGFEFQQDTTGTVLTIASNFIEKVYHQKPIIRTAFEYAQIIHFTEDQEAHKIDRLLAELTLEIYDSRPLKDFKIETLFNGFFTDIYRLSVKNHEYLSEQKNRSLLLLGQFQKNIRLANNPQRSITSYAQELSITQVHLNRICKNSIRKTAIQIVHEYFIGQAQNYLQHTSYSVSEIAYQLNFNDASYFSRLFKNIVGVSPRAFRLKYGGEALAV